MKAQTTYMIARQRIADLPRVSARPGIASEVRAGQPNPSHPKNETSVGGCGVG